MICPSGLTRMTEDLSADFGSDEQQALKEKQATAHRTNEYVGGSPNNVAPLIAWLVSPDGADVTGRVFNTNAFANGYQIAESFSVTPWKTKEGENWTHDEIGETMSEMLADETRPTIYDNHMAAARSRM